LCQHLHASKVNFWYKTLSCILILEVEKEKRYSSKNYKEKRKLAKASKVSARKNHSTRDCSARKTWYQYQTLEQRVQHQVSVIWRFECPNIFTCSYNNILKMHYAIETEHQTDRENMLMQKILKSYNGERMKVHTLNQKKQKWACKHTPLLLEACTIMGQWNSWNYLYPIANEIQFFLR
jgi:hypothetical protein